MTAPLGVLSDRKINESDQNGESSHSESWDVVRNLISVFGDTSALGKALHAGSCDVDRYTRVAGWRLTSFQFRGTTLGETSQVVVAGSTRSQSSAYRGSRDSNRASWSSDVHRVLRSDFLDRAPIDPVRREWIEDFNSFVVEDDSTSYEKQIMNGGKEATERNEGERGAGRAVQDFTCYKSQQDRKSGDSDRRTALRLEGVRIFVDGSSLSERVLR